MKRTYQASKVRRAPHPRLSRSHEIARRPRSHQRPPRQGAQAPGGLSDRSERSMPRRQPAVEAMARLVDSSAFERVLRTPSRATTTHFAAHHLPEASVGIDKSPPQTELSTNLSPDGARPVDDLCATVPRKHVGAVVPKRHARRSVTRSLLKRQIYGAVGRRVAALDDGLWIVRLRAPFDRARFPSAGSVALRTAARCELESLFDAVLRRQAS